MPRKKKAAPIHEPQPGLAPPALSFAAQTQESIEERTKTATLQFARGMIKQLIEGEGKEDPEATVETIDLCLKNLAEIRRPGVSRLIIELRGLRKNYGS